MAVTPIKISQTGDKRVTISNLGVKGEIYVYDMAATQVIHTVSADGSISINVPHKGIYIIKTIAAAQEGTDSTKCFVIIID